MVTVQVRRNAANEVVELRCRGHAGFDDGLGNDLVCAAVSALTGALGLGLTEVAALAGAVEVGPGRFDLRLEPDQAHQVALLTETVARALEQLQEHYRGSLQVQHLKERKSGQN